MLDALKILEESVIHTMSYYCDKDGVYYYLEKSDVKVYDNQIVEPDKSSTDEAGSSGFGVLSTYARAYFDKLFGKITAYNQVYENWIMGRIEDVVKDAEECKKKMKEEIKAEIKESEARVVVEVQNLKGFVEHLQIFAFLFAIDPPVIAQDATYVALDPTTAPSTNLAVDLP